MAADKALRFFRFHRSGFGVLSLGVGIITGAVCVLFKKLIAAWTWVMTGYTWYDGHVGDPNGHFSTWGYWFLIFTPVISGLIYGPMIKKWAPSARGHGIPEVMLAVRREGGRIPGAVAVVKLLASALTLGGGASAGREGPVVQIGAALASWWSRFVRLDSHRTKMLVACGAAAGIAATFNSPFAGAVFALEVILGLFTAEAFGMMVVSAVGASVTADILSGNELIVKLPENLKLMSDLDFGWIFLLGIIGGLAGVGFSKMLYRTEDIMDWIYSKVPLSEAWRPAFFGGLLGLGLFFFPLMFGAGQHLQLLVFDGKFSILVLLAFVLGRGIFTSFTMGMGGSGGVFAPSLFIGACTGCAFGQLIAPLAKSPAALFGVIGMGAAFAGAARAPITAVLIIIEMTGQYSLVLPLMLAISMATGVSRFLTRKTIYTEKLLRRGDVIDDPVAGTLLGRTSAEGIMEVLPGELHGNDTLGEAAHLLRISGYQTLPVVASETDRTFLGCLTSLQVAHLLADGANKSKTLKELTLIQAHCSPKDLPSTVLATLLDSNITGMPVVSKQNELLGWISQRGLVSRIYRQQRRAIDSAAAESSFGSRWQATHKQIFHFPWQQNQ